MEDELTKFFLLNSLYFPQLSSKIESLEEDIENLLNDPIDLSSYRLVFIYNPSNLEKLIEKRKWYLEKFINYFLISLPLHDIATTLSTQELVFLNKRSQEKKVIGIVNPLTEKIFTTKEWGGKYLKCNSVTQINNALIFLSDLYLI